MVNFITLEACKASDMFVTFYLLRGKVVTTTFGVGIDLGRNMKVSIPYHGVAKIDIELPTLLTRGSSGNNDIVDLRAFFGQDNGSIAISQAICTTHHINIPLAAKKKAFTKMFLSSILGLQRVANVVFIENENLTETSIYECMRIYTVLMSH